MDLEAQFCERCGRDSSEFASAHLAFHDCPSCGVTCCSDCWNLVEAACLRCAPFRLPGEPEFRTSCHGARTPDRRARQPRMLRPRERSRPGAGGPPRRRRYDARHRVPAGPRALPRRRVNRPMLQRSQAPRPSEPLHRAQPRCRSPRSSRFAGCRAVAGARGGSGSRRRARGWSWRPWRSRRSAQRRAGPPCP